MVLLVAILTPKIRIFNSLQNGFPYLVSFSPLKQHSLWSRQVQVIILKIYIKTWAKGPCLFICRDLTLCPNSKFVPIAQANGLTPAAPILGCWQKHCTLAWIAPWHPLFWNQAFVHETRPPYPTSFPRMLWLIFKTSWKIFGKKKSMHKF